MSSITTVPAPTQSIRTSIREIIADVGRDRAVAIVACLPFAWLAYYRLAFEGVDLPRIAMALSYALLIVTMAIRRPPVRVTPKPLYWATAFVATYWIFLTLTFTERGTAIAPMAITHALAILSLAIAVVARFSLGRNIGFVPAQRELVTSGAYAFVRHPIYTGLFVSLIGVALRAYSPRNVLILAIGASLFIVKSFMEERFLSEDPVYARYMRVVRWRWFPGIA